MRNQIIVLGISSCQDRVNCTSIFPKTSLAAASTYLNEAQEQGAMKRECSRAPPQSL